MNMKELAYIFVIFILASSILFFPSFLMNPLEGLFILPQIIIGGIIIAGISAYLLTPFSLRKVVKPFKSPPEKLVRMVEELSQKAGLKKMPKLMITETPEINAMAYSTLLGPRVVLTRGTVEAWENGKITDDEMRGVIAHEIAHIKHYDPFKSAFVLSWVSFFETIGELFMIFGSLSATVGAIFGTYGSTDEERSAGGMVLMLGLLSMIFGFILMIIAKIASIFSLHYKRRQEYQADELAGKLVMPQVMANALRKVKTLNDELLEKQLASLPYSDRWQMKPRKTSFLDRLFDTHPPFEKRIKRLEDRT